MFSSFFKIIDKDQDIKVDNIQNGIIQVGKTTSTAEEEEITDEQFFKTLMPNSTKRRFLFGKSKEQDSIA